MEGIQRLQTSVAVDDGVQSVVRHHTESGNQQQPEENDAPLPRGITMLRKSNCNPRPRILTGIIDTHGSSAIRNFELNI
eukprot:scaffold15998_cov181-Amphora_coffeaeformis.AAC.2